MNKAIEKSRDDAVPTGKKIEDLYKLIEGIELAMMVTREADGSLVSRPMQTQSPEKGIDLWFMTSTDTHKLDQMRRDPEINLSYFSSSSKEWVSVSGTAHISQDPAKIQRLYKKDWKAWLGDEGGAKDGGPKDPRIALIEVDAHAVTYLKSTDSRPVALFKVAKAIVTGEPPKTGDLRHVSKEELHQPRA